MIDLRKAAEMALEALMDANKFEYKDEIAALRQTLAQPEPFKPDWVSYRQGVADGAAQPEQEPVAYMGSAGLGYDKNKYLSIPLYTAPPRKEWVGLTDDDVAEVERWVEFKEAGSGQIVIGKLVRYIELKLRSKNNAV